VHRAWQSPALDAAVYAQPLVVGDRVYVATEANTVYALSASNGKVAWKHNLGPPVSGGSLPCGNIDPSGITSTPTIDVTARRIYVLAFQRSGPHHELYALDLSNGSVVWHRHLDPSGLSPTVEQERGALALSNGRVYAPFGGLQGDCGPYKGAVVSSATDGEGALAQYVLPTSREGGIWTPAGPVADEKGDIWVSTGNTASQGSFDYGNAIIRLSAALHVQDYFAPSNWAALNAGDVDLGSVGPVLLSPTRVVAAGKAGIAYVLKRNDLGHIGGDLASTNVCSRAFGQPAHLGSVVYIACEDAAVAVHVGSNSISRLWTKFGEAGPTIIAAGVVWSIRGDGRLTALDLRSGATRYEVSLGSPVSRFVSPSAANGKLFAPTANHIVAFALR
jgi:outer membrane protein assembly factor BamB